VNEEELIKAKLKPRKARKEWKMFFVLGFAISLVLWVLISLILTPYLYSLNFSDRASWIIATMVSFAIGFTFVHRSHTKEIDDHEDNRRDLEKLKRKLK
jgi:putative flippase GtrA|tara:strand:+ start:422 stop:718 length:297 start_codon:yes stop_codon:yes gene_type:complete